MRACLSPKAVRTVFAGLVLSAASLPALAAGPYEFVPAPQIDLNRVYRVDRSTGEVTSCQYGLRDDNVGVTLCFAAGEGAAAQAPAEYGLVASRHTREAGVFRVNYRTGEMSICYVQVREELVVCTPQTNPAPAGSPSAAPATKAAPSVTPPQGARP
ncbi:hypothetical protein [Methylobacterium haplocladii]|uniref:Uncharacterized protein n=1 Tax=Methylobacterium haplocladii TaxID=1176176 RepID=A0A512IT72_9HYPH|nr:hypothetical protein [Methylobacterium haplocladii]GEP00915.1 hypothetical protein MHA02_33020 [Methylobacterium haplocladii]GJD82241.1 hypothetical protein HPGCJGGD_0093 [Methylobacterium haplocladii]GLS58853.1 hypothetical protein GCM10007887_15190 [Methylobacterium haplocladii]